MNKNKITNYKPLVFIFLFFFISSCAKLPTQTEIDNADYGKTILQDEAQKQAIVFFTNHFKDPSSAQYNWSKVVKGWVRRAPIKGSKLFYGYTLNVNANAKNSFGGYVGFSKYTFLFINGKLKIVIGPKTTLNQRSYGELYFKKD